MESIFSFPKLVQHMKMEIPNNIKIGQMENQILSENPLSLIKRVIPQLKKEFLSDHSEILNTPEKIEHVQMVLDKILMQKYDFAKQNIQEGEKFNEFYIDDKIELPKQERTFQCVNCIERFFKTKASLHSHYRSCKQNNNEEKMGKVEDENIKNERPQGFQPLKIKGPKPTETKPARVFAAEVIKKNNEIKRVEEQKKVESQGKRSRPGSSCSLGSDIFFEE